MKPQRAVRTHCEGCCRRRRCVALPRIGWWLCRECLGRLAKAALELVTQTDWEAKD